MSGQPELGLAWTGGLGGQGGQVPDDDRSATRGRRLPRALGTLAAVALVAVGAGYYQRADTAAAVRAGSGSASSPGASPETSPEANPESSPGPDPAPATDPPSEPAPRLPPAGPGLTRPGITLQVAPAPGGALDVAETVRLPSPTDVLVLRAPRVNRAAGDFAEVVATANQVQLTVDGQPVVIPTEIGGTPVTVQLESATDSYALRYLLVGTTVRSVPSTAGRALAAISSLSRPSDAGPVMIYATGPTIRNLSCPLLAPAEVACGRGAAPELRLREALPGGAAVALLQLDLPR